MTSGRFMSWDRDKTFNNLLTETQDSGNHDQYYSSWDSPINIQLNYWVLLTVPILLIIAFLIEARKKYFPRQEKQQPIVSNFPCYRCKYFNQNPYLKCAVNPMLALTQESYDCQSFQENNN